MHQTPWAPKKLISHILILIIVSRIILTIIGVGSLAMIESKYNTRHGTLENSVQNSPLIIKAWASWDSTFYERIARDGYPSHLDVLHYNNYGFFPGYPLLMYIFGNVFFLGNTLMAGVFVSTIAFGIAAYFLFRLVEEEYGEEKAVCALYLLFFQPFAFIFTTVMSEGLFLMLAVLTFWFLKKNKILPAAGVAFYASITRPVGILLSIPVIILLIKKHLAHPSQSNLKTSLLNGSTMLGSLGAGLLSVCTYFYYKSGDFFAYTHSQSIAWGHTLSNPIVQLFKGLTNPNPHIVINGIILILYAIVLLLSMRKSKLKLEYSAYAFPSLFFHTFTGFILSSLRYGATVFPIVIGGALILKTESQKTITYAALAMIQGVFMAAWTIGLFFTS